MSLDKHLRASAMGGKTIRFKNWWINFNKKGIDISNGMRGTFLFHPFTKHFSFKQYLGAYSWIIKGKAIIFALLLISSCSTRHIPTEVPSEIPEPDVVVPEVKELSPIVTITECRYCTDAEKLKYEKVLAKMREVMHSQCFKDFILNRKMIQTSERTSQEVLDHVLGHNREVSLELYYKRFSRVVGYTYPDTNNIWFNRKFHDRYGICQSASNLSHEAAGHKNGYDHLTSDKSDTVPYSFNAGFDTCCKEEN